MRCKQMFFALVAMLSCFVSSAFAQNVAKVGDTEYATLRAAISAAQSGNTVTLIGDVNESVTVSKNLTIDGAGETYTGTMTINTGLTVTVTNVNFFNAGIVKASGTKGTITVKDCTFDGADRTYDYAVKTSGAGKLTIENCTVKDYSYGFLYNSKSLTTHSVKNVTVENCNYGVRMGSTYTTNLVNFVTSNVKYPVQIQANDARTVNMTDCSIYEVPEGGASLSCWGGTSNVTFNFKGTNNFDAELPTDANFIYKDANGNQTENNNNDNVVIVKPAVAKVGEQGYESLAKAIEAASAGLTITLLADINENVTLSKSLTIDGAGLNYTGNIAVNGKSVAATVKNVNFVDGSGYAITTNTIKSITVENCTVKNYGYGFLYANKSTPTVTVKNVTVDGGNYGFHWVYGNKATLENVKMTNVANGLYIQNYASKTITLKNCEISSIGIWERDGYSGIQTFKFEGVNEVSSLTTSSYAKIVAGAQVGTKLYETLDAAFAAAQDNDEVKVLTAGTYALSTSGKDITITGAVDGVVFDNIGAKNMGGANVTFNNVTFDYYPNVNYTGLQHSGNLVYNNCTINGQVFLYGQSETFNNCTFNQNSADAYNVWTYGAKDVDFNECTFNSVGKSVLVYTESTTATNDVAFTNCELIASAPVEGKAAIEIDTSLSAGATITVDGETTATGFGSGNVSGNSLWNNKKGNATAANNDVTVVVNGETVLAPIPDVAKIGETGYRTLAEAIAAIGAGDVVIELLDNATFDYNARDAYGTAETTSVTINGNGHTLTLNQKNSDWSSFGLAAGNVVLNNMTIEKTGYGDTNGAWNTHAIIFSSPVEMNNVTVNNGIAVQAGATLNNVTINEANGYYGLWINGNGQAVTVNGGAINATNGGRGIKIADQYIEAPAKVTLSVTGTKFSTAKKAAVLVSSKAGADIAASNVNIENVDEDKVNFVWVDEDWAQHYANVQVEGATKAQEGIEGFVAQLPNGASYKTLAAAVEAAPAGATVTLLADAAEDATVVLTKNLTIDGAGNTFTGAIEFKKSNGYFTIKNVKFNGAGDRVYALKSQSNTTSLTVEGCTATGYTYGFLYANSAIANVIVTDVTVKDVNYGVHSARGTNVTLNNFVAENVEYGVMVQNYTGRNVVLNNCSFTDSKNPLYVWERNQTNKITFNFEGANEMGKADFCASAMAVINADAVVGTKVCGTLAAAVEAAQAGETVTLLRNAQLDSFVTINKSITLNMGEYNITRDGGTALYVNGDVEVVINGTTGTVTGSQALWVANGLAKVYGGNFCGVAEAVYVQNTGKAEIYGGTFSSSNYGSFVLNKKDDSRETASITVYGGTFVGFNPADNAAEGAGTNFVAAGLMAVDNGDGTFGIAKANIKMGDSYYATLAEAIAAIGAGDVVIELLADATLDYGAREAYGTAETTSVTINGNGKTLTLNQTNSDWSSFGLAAGNVVLNNMTIEKTGYGDTSGAWNTHAIIFSSPVEMNNVTVNNAVAVQAGATLNNVTINEANGYYGLWINGNGQAVTVNGGAINATNGGRGIKIADQYIDAPAQVTLNVDGTVFSTAKKAAVLVSSTAGAKIAAANVNIESVAEDKVNFVWVDEDWSPYFVEVEVTGATKAQEGIENLVAQRSNGASYKTLAAAITAATAGETIILIGNTEEDVTVSKNLTIEGAGMQYTGIMTLNKVNVTVQNLNIVKGQISKSKNYNGGNVTIVNCNFDGQGMNSYAVNVARTGSVVIENVTAQNYGYGFLQLSHANNKLSIKDVKVVNTNYALKIDYSNGVTIDGLKVEDVKVAAIYNSNYGAKTYTIKNSDFSGAAEAIKMWERNTTVYDTFVFAGGNTLGNATLSTSPYAIYEGVVAEVGTKKYFDLRVAFDAAQNDETVKMLDNVTLDTKTLATQNDGYAAIINVAGKAVTLDLNGKNITVDAAAADLSANGKMLLGVFSADLGGHLTLTDNSDAKNGAVTLNVNDANVYSMFVSESGQSDKSKNGKLTVNGGNYTTVGKVSNAMFFTDANEVITVNGGNFYCYGATTTASYPWMFNTYLNNEIHVIVNGGTFNVDVNHQHRPFEVYVPETSAVNANGNGTWTVVPAVAYITEMLGGTVYESGDLEHKVGYATLAAAVEAAQEKETVTLLKDVEGAGVVIDKDLTIDFNGKTYTFTEGVGSTGTESNGFQILKENDVVLMNGTLNVAAASASKFYTIIQNYANLTVEDMTLDGTNLDKWSLTDGDSYVFSNNSGNIVVQGNTNITANNDGDKAFAFDADKTANVTVKTTGTIAGKVEKADGATIAISSGTFTEEILPEWCAEYYVPVQNAEGKWTVEYRYTDEMTIVDGSYTEFVNEREITVGTLTYERDFTNFSGWQTLFVPFEIPVEQLTNLGYEVAYFYDVHYDVHDEVIDPTKISSVHFIVVNKGTLRANFPYLIKRTSEANPLLSVTLYDAKLYSTAASELNTVESSSTTTRFVFAGTYKKMGRVALTGDDNTPCYRFNPQGQVQKMSATANLVPFRVCMYIKAKDGSPVILDETNAPEYIKMRVIGEENEDGTTTIYDVNAEEAEEMIFDLSGRRVLETEKGGIYIKNGKKVLVK